MLIKELIEGYKAAGRRFHVVGTESDGIIIALDVEGIEYAVAHVSRVAQLEVVAFFFLVGFLVVEEVAFQCGHLRLVEEW